MGVAFRIFALLGKNPKRKQNLTRSVTQLADAALATALSPFQSVAKVTRLFIGICAPKTLFKDPSNLVMRRQLDASCAELSDFFDWRNLEKFYVLKETKLSDYKSDFEIDRDKLANLALLSASFFYAQRWGILRGSVSQTYLNRDDQRKKFGRLEIDPLSSRLNLFVAYKNLIDDWSQNKDHIADQSLKDFFGNNFKTDREKEVLKKAF